MPTDPSKPAAKEADGATAFNQALVQSLNQATEQLPSSTLAALAARRAQALGNKPNHWHWALAASLLLALGMLTWHAPPPDADAMALDILQTDDQLLSEIDLLETLAEVDET